MKLHQLRRGVGVDVLVNVDMYFQDYRQPNKKAPDTIGSTGAAHDNFFIVEEVLEQNQALIRDSTREEWFKWRHRTIIPCPLPTSSCVSRRGARPSKPVGASRQR
jgi:hypothetical protein